MNTGGSSRRVVDHRFELVERLGSGGMGMVWRAHDLALHRDVALKEVRPPDPALAEYDPEGARTLRARVLREARALARIDHPNVVTIHHIVDPGEDAYPWIVMELVAGSSLQDRLAEGPMEPAAAAELGRGVLAALRAAHAAGIQHRDVKPANVLLRTDGRPVLTDFGIAAIRESTSLTMTGALIGSPDYIAPERIRGTEGDPRSDLWSLGMMLYVAVEGHHPLRRATTLATLAAVLDEPVPPPVRAGSLAPVLDALLTRDTTARPDVETLDRMLAEVARPSPSPTVNLIPEGRRPSHRVATATPAPASMPAPAPAPTTGNPYASAVPGNPYAYPSTTTPARLLDRRRRRIRTLAVTSSLAGTALIAGILVRTLVPPGGSGSDDRPGSASSSPGADRGTLPTPRTSTPGASAPAGAAERPSSLLTPDGARAAVKALKPVMGSTRVTDFTLFRDFATAQSPLTSNSRLYDRFTYRDGKAVREESGGGQLMEGDKAIDLTTIDWDALPKLLRTAEKTLNVDKPESSYVIVDPSSPFQDDQPVLRVYVSDKYGGAFLTARIDGRIIEKNPRARG